MANILSKKAKELKDKVKQATTNPAQAVQDAIVRTATGGLVKSSKDIPTAEEVGKKLSINTLTDKEDKEAKAKADKEAEEATKAKIKAEALARYQSGVSSGSQFMDMSDKYVGQFGPGDAAVSAMMGDLSFNAFNPIANQFGQMAQQAGPQVNIDPAFRNYQMGLANQLAAQARGEGPSLAQLQLQQATDRTLNQSLGAIRAATGPNAALAGRTAAMAASGQMANMGAASGIARLQEQQAAQNALAQLAASGRQADTAGESLRVGTDLEGRKLQQQALGGQMQAAGQSIQGSRDVFGNILGISAENRAEQRAGETAEKKKEDSLWGAAAAGLSTYLGGLG